VKFVQVNNVVLNCCLSGNPNGVPLVFINSLGTDWRIWNEVVPHFEGRFRVVRYDKRGHGLSDCPPAPYSIRDHAEDLAGLLDVLSIETAVLIGISVGGLIAQDFAAAWPERVQQLVLCDTAAKIGTAEMWNGRIHTLRAAGMEPLADAILSRWFALGFGRQNPAAYQGYRHMLTRTPVTGYIGTCEAIRDADLTEATRTIQAPTLVLCGAEDSATTPEVVRGLAALLPNACYEEIPKAGHLPCVEQPEATAVAIIKFLQQESEKESNGKR
jgi:3-oxoadipate enol-lactonase